MAKAKDVSAKDEAAVGTQHAPAKPEEEAAGLASVPKAAAAEQQDEPRRGRKLRAMSRMVHTRADGTEEVLEAGEVTSVDSMFAKMHPHMFELA